MLRQIFAETTAAHQSAGTGLVEDKNVEDAVCVPQICAVIDPVG